MWTVAGGPDPDFDDVVHELEYVWDCPRDGTVNVVGCLCAHAAAGGHWGFP